MWWRLPSSPPTPRKRLRDLLAAYLDELRSLNHSPTTLRGIGYNNKAFFKWLEDQGYCLRTMLELLYSSGLRVAELLGLDLDSLDLRNATALVMGKGRKQRVVPMGRTAIQYLDNYLNGIRPHLEVSREEKALFLDPFGKRYPYHTLRRRLHVYAGKAGIDIQVTPHTFRRSCTTELLRGGANMYHVKEMLGHESLDTLKHYARLTITDLKITHRKCHPRESDRSPHP